MIQLLQRKNTLIGIGLVVAILLFVYYKGRSDANDCPWYKRLVGGCDDDTDRKIYVPTGPGAPWKPQSITNRLFSAIDNHGIFTPNGDAINDAFFAFNSLSDQQKFDVVNDWEQRIKGRDVSGWFTGDYGSLRETIEQWDGNYQPEVSIAYNWMNNNGI